MFRSFLTFTIKPLILGSLIYIYMLFIPEAPVSINIPELGESVGNILVGLPSIEIVSNPVDIDAQVCLESLFCDSSSIITNQGQFNTTPDQISCYSGNKINSFSRVHAAIYSFNFQHDLAWGAPYQPAMPDFVKLLPEMNSSFKANLVNYDYRQLSAILNSDHLIINNMQDRISITNKQFITPSLQTIKHGELGWTYTMTSQDLYHNNFTVFNETALRDHIVTFNRLKAVLKFSL